MSIIFSTGSGFWPSRSWLEEEWWPYVDFCKQAGETPISKDTNRIDEPIPGPQCACSGITWERLDDSGHYWQCEMCGECIDIQADMEGR